MPAEETREDVEKRVDFEFKLKQLQGNYTSFEKFSFAGVELSRQPEWVGQVGATLAENTTCKELDLSSTGITDAGVQQLAIALCNTAKCPQLKLLNLCDNPLSPMAETVLSGLRRLRPNLNVSLGEAPLFDGFVHQKKILEGLSAWAADDLQVPGTQGQSLYCPEEIAGAGVKLELKRGFQGANGTKFKCDLAVFELYNATGNLVLLELLNKKEDADAGTLV